MVVIGNMMMVPVGVIEDMIMVIEEEERKGMSLLLKNVFV